MSKWVSEIPEDWNIVTLEDYAIIKARIGWRGLKAKEYTNLGPYLIANKHIINDKVSWKDCDHLSEFRYEESPEIQLKENDVIMSKDGTIGRIAHIEKLPGKATLNSTMMLIRTTNMALKSLFLYYFFQSRFFDRFIYERVSGSTVPHIFQKDMRALNVILPTIIEQQAISSILNNVDNITHQTRQLIYHLKLLKKGLMQQLFTQGIGHTEFKETKIGKTPKNWDVVKLGSIVQENNGLKRGPWGGSVKKAYFVEKGFKIYEQGNVIKCDFSSGNYYIDEKKFEELKTFEIEPGDLLLTAAGTIGRVEIVPENIEKGIYNQALIRIRLKKNVNKEYIRYFFQSTLLQRMLETYSDGSALHNLASIKILKEIYIPTPSAEEQRKIVNIIQKIEGVESTETSFKQEIDLIKKGLMQELLTGKRRVPKAQAN